MPIRVSPTDRIRTKIDELFAEERELPEILEDVARLGAQLLMQAALDADHRLQAATRLQTGETCAAARHDAHAHSRGSQPRTWSVVLCPDKRLMTLMV
jgi:putative transposase